MRGPFATSFVLLLSLFAVTGCQSMELDDPPTPGSHVVGLGAAEAAAKLAELGYEAVWYDRELALLESDWVPDDESVVIWQDPLHHEAADRFDGEFALLVGPAGIVPQMWVTIPDLTDETVADARAQLAALGLRMAVYDQDGNLVESPNANKVIVKNHATTPAGATTHVGATVGVIIVVLRS